MTTEIATHIFVTFTRVGFHRWPGAPDHRSYLTAPHRHVFGYRIETNVHHQDREIEFHDLQEFCKAAVPDYQLHGAKSCEALALELADRLNAHWPDRVWFITVDEDGECGATVSMRPL